MATRNLTYRSDQMILEDHSEDGWMVWSDWLDDDDQPERAARIRLDITNPLPPQVWQFEHRYGAVHTGGVVGAVHTGGVVGGVVGGGVVGVGAFGVGVGGGGGGGGVGAFGVGGVFGVGGGVFAGVVDAGGVVGGGGGG